MEKTKVPSQKTSAEKFKLKLYGDNLGRVLLNFKGYGLMVRKTMKRLYIGLIKSNSTWISSRWSRDTIKKG